MYHFDERNCLLYILKTIIYHALAEAPDIIGESADSTISLAKRADMFVEATSIIHSLASQIRTIEFAALCTEFVKARGSPEK